VLDGGDSYEGLRDSSRVLIDAEQGSLMATALEKYISGREIGPEVEGRIIIEP
jgi:hypothetical protein